MAACSWLVRRGRLSSNCSLISLKHNNYYTVIVDRRQLCPFVAVDLAHRVCLCTSRGLHDSSYTALYWYCKLITSL